MKKATIYQVVIVEQNGKRDATDDLLLDRDDVEAYLGTFNSLTHRTGRSAYVVPLPLKLYTDKTLPKRAGAKAY